LKAGDVSLRFEAYVIRPPHKRTDRERLGKDKKVVPGAPGCGGIINGELGPKEAGGR
jgi:hypothetical protein